VEGIDAGLYPDALRSIAVRDPSRDVVLIFHPLLRDGDAALTAAADAKPRGELV
jgi:hypothetical protein